jgi:hypothetical protein
MLKEETRSGGLVTTSLHPGHIVGLGWHPIGPLGNIDATVWHKLSAGQLLDVPGIHPAIRARRRNPGVGALAHRP